MCIYRRATFNNVGATAAVPRQVRGRTRLSGSRLMAVLLAFACGLVLPLLLSVRVAAQTVPAQSDCGSDAYLASLPVKPPKGNDIKRQVQLVNCSDQVLLGAANAARAAGQPPWPVFPQEGTWVMQPFNQEPHGLFQRAHHRYSSAVVRPACRGEHGELLGPNRLPLRSGGQPGAVRDRRLFRSI